MATKKKPTRGAVPRPEPGELAGQAGRTPAADLPAGTRLLWEAWVGDELAALAWSPDGTYLAALNAHGTLWIWCSDGTLYDHYNIRVSFTRQKAYRFEASAHCQNLLWSPNGQLLIASYLNSIVLVNVNTLSYATEVSLGAFLTPLFFAEEDIVSLSDFGLYRISPHGTDLTHGQEITTSIDLSGCELIGRSAKHAYISEKTTGKIYQVSLSGTAVRVAQLASLPNISQLVELSKGSERNRAPSVLTAEYDGTVRLRTKASGALQRVLEGHSSSVINLAISADQQTLVSVEQDGACIIWSLATWEKLGQIQCAPSSYALAYHPTQDVLATTDVGRDGVRVLALDRSALLHSKSQSRERDLHYRNAKIVLVGDSGVGKSGLGLVLSGQPYRPTDSTHGRFVWNLGTQEVELEPGRSEVRETLLWDLAGQPGYRLIHQLHLDEVAVAVVVFDAKSETDPFAGVGHWAKALQTAIRVQGDSAPPMCRYLVAARTDRGRVAARRARIEQTVRELGFDGFFETSARDGSGIAELQAALRAAIPWESLVQVSSTQLFKRIKDFLLAQKQRGRLLPGEEELFLAFKEQPDSAAATREAFRVCLLRLESSGLLRRLSFGTLVLLQPEILDAYASAIVNEARAEPDGLGSISESKVLRGQFNLPADERLPDRERERLLLNATIEDMVRHEIALRETEYDGAHLVFPSQLTRERPDLPDPPGKAAVLEFEGPTHNIYSTLVVRLSHSHAFRKQELWRNAVQFVALPGGRCGLAMRDFDGRAELTVFYDPTVGADSRVLFEDYVRKHLSERALPGSVSFQPVLSCPACGQELPARSIRSRLKEGKTDIGCSGCDARLPLHAAPRPTAVSEGVERKREAMDASADRARDREAGLLSASAALTAPDFREWLGDGRQLALVLLRSVHDSTRAGRSSRTWSAWRVYRDANRDSVQRALHKDGGRELKELGETAVYGFRAVSEAVAFARALLGELAALDVKLRAAVHAAPAEARTPEARQALVREAAQLEAEADEPGLWLSAAAQEMLGPPAPPPGLESPTGELPPGRGGDSPTGHGANSPTGHGANSAPGPRVAVLTPGPPSGASGEPLLEVALRCNRSAHLDTAALLRRFGGNIQANQPSPGRFVLSWYGLQSAALVQAAESAALDKLVAADGIRYVEWVRAGKDWLYERLPEKKFAVPALEDVDPAVLSQHRGAIDLGLLTTTPVERKAVLAQMKPLPGEKSILEGSLGASSFRLGRFGRYSAVHFESTMGTQSRSGAMLTVNDALREWRLKAVVVIGIAFGVDRQKQRLGDVLVAEAVQPYELQRVGSAQTVTRGLQTPCGRTLSDRFRSRSGGWEVVRVNSDPVRIHQGLLLSGEKLIDSREFRDQLVHTFPTALGGEMEGVGAYAAADRCNTEIILVKSICDWADGHKNDRAQPFAAFTAVSLVHHVLSKPGVLAALSATDI